MPRVFFKYMLMLAVNSVLAINPPQQELSNDNIEKSIMALIDSADHYVYDAPDRSLMFGQKAQLLAAQANRKNLDAVIANRIGVAYWSKGELVQAIEFLTESHDLAEEMEDYDLVTRNIGNLANVYSAAGLHASSIALAHQALEYFQTKENWNRVFVYNNNIAKSYLDSDQLDSARKYFDRTMAVYRDDFEPMLPIVIFNLAELAFKEMKSDESDSLLRLSQNYAMELDDKRAICRTHQMMAERNLKIGNAKLALDNAKTAFEVAANSGVHELIQIAANTLSRAYYENGMPSEALEMLLTSNEHRDILENNKIKNQLEVLRYLDQQKTISSLQVSNEQERETSRIRANIIIGLMTALMIIGFMVYVVIKSRKRLEIQAIELKKLTDFQSSVLGIVSHDIRSPVANLYSAIAMFESSLSFDDRNMEIFKILKHDTQSIISLLDSLVLWAKEHIKGQEFIRSELNISDVLDLVEADLSDSIARKRIGIQRHLDIEVIRSNAEMLRIILRNLISNAIKYSDQETIVDIYAHMKNGKIVLEVKDHGLGMSQSEIDGLFEGDIKQKRGTLGERGSGIGLMLCQSFSKIIGGEITVSSKPGKGSTFYLMLPVG